ncbi:hypothetical protein GGR51DRAFT_22692 [Nemania sp. FL0031]|nr:hypothetical protein GGR51DRAFT_22692 [Nemania sp. FL0031]
MFIVTPPRLLSAVRIRKLSSILIEGVCCGSALAALTGFRYTHTPFECICSMLILEMYQVVLHRSFFSLPKLHVVYATRLSWPKPASHWFFGRFGTLVCDPGATVIFPSQRGADEDRCSLLVGTEIILRSPSGSMN